MRVRNFKVFSNIQVKNFSRLNVFMGPNGSGKTTFFKNFFNTVLSIFAGVIANPTDRKMWDVFGNVRERLKEGGELVNHDLQRAVRRAYLEATLFVCESCMRKEFGVEASFLQKKFRKISGSGSPDIRQLENIHESLKQELGKVSKAEKIKNSVINGIFEEIANSQAEAGDFDAAFKTIQMAQSEGYSFCGLCGIAIAQAEYGKFDDALKTVQKIHDKSQKVEALSIIATEQARCGKKETSRKNLDIALDMALRAVSRNIREFRICCNSTSKIGFS
ncbi:MAG: hypothetical protein B6245_19465 [Desulfobacteraceae bacterium 4572_88]|nr:MAG: hypothetical protein B6245_19465 [Desulfobacteraceae bacterium 4572_88]